MGLLTRLIIEFHLKKEQLITLLIE